MFKLLAFYVITTWYQYRQLYNGYRSIMFFLTCTLQSLTFDVGPFWAMSQDHRKTYRKKILPQKRIRNLRFAFLIIFYSGNLLLGNMKNIITLNVRNNSITTFSPPPPPPPPLRVSTIYMKVADLPYIDGILVSIFIKAFCKRYTSSYILDRLCEFPCLFRNETHVIQSAHSIHFPPVNCVYRNKLRDGGLLIKTP